MKRVILKFYGLGYNDIFQANVKIYNNKNQCILNTKTYDNIVVCSLEEKQVYLIEAISQSEIIRQKIYVDNNKYCFFFPRSIVRNIFTFQLTDFYYENLPIEKGEIILG